MREENFFMGQEKSGATGQIVHPTTYGIITLFFVYSMCAFAVRSASSLSFVNKLHFISDE